MLDDPFNPSMKRMLFWQKACITGCLAACFFPIAINSTTLLIEFGIVLLLFLILVVFLFRTARHECGGGYAMRQTILMILMSPFFGLGIIVVPLLVKSDLEKLRRAAGTPEPPICKECGYDLHAHNHEACPECGTTVTPTPRG